MNSFIIIVSLLIISIFFIILYRLFNFIIILYNKEKKQNFQHKFLYEQMLDVPPIIVTKEISTTDITDELVITKILNEEQREFVENQICQRIAKELWDKRLIEHEITPEYLSPDQFKVISKIKIVNEKSN